MSEKTGFILAVAVFVNSLALALHGFNQMRTQAKVGRLESIVERIDEEQLAMQKALRQMKPSGDFPQ